MHGAALPATHARGGLTCEPCTGRPYLRPMHGAALPATHAWGGLTCEPCTGQPYLRARATLSACALPDKAQRPMCMHTRRCYPHACDLACVHCMRSMPAWHGHLRRRSPPLCPYPCVHAHVRVHAQAATTAACGSGTGPAVTAFSRTRRWCSRARSRRRPGSTPWASMSGGVWWGGAPGPHSSYAPTSRRWGRGGHQIPRCAGADTFLHFWQRSSAVPEGALRIHIYLCIIKSAGAPEGPPPSHASPSMLNPALLRPIPSRGRHSASCPCPSPTASHGPTHSSHMPSSFSLPCLWRFVPQWVPPHHVRIGQDHQNVEGRRRSHRGHPPWLTIPPTQGHQTFLGWAGGLCTGLAVQALILWPDFG